MSETPTDYKGPKRVLSGMQPTGQLHLGNYLGALKNWVGLQDDPDRECFYCVVDMHAITVFQNPKELAATTRELAAFFIAAGLDPEKNILFNQSKVAGHAEPFELATHESTGLRARALALGPPQAALQTDRPGTDQRQQQARQHDMARRAHQQRRDGRSQRKRGCGTRSHSRGQSGLEGRRSTPGQEEEVSARARRLRPADTLESRCPKPLQSRTRPRGSRSRSMA